MCINLQNMSETALFSGKFTQLTKILHDRRSRRSRQIPSLLPIQFSDIDEIIYFFSSKNAFFYRAFANMCKTWQKLRTYLQIPCKTFDKPCKYQSVALLLSKTGGKIERVLAPVEGFLSLVIMIREGSGYQIG